ncbi:hypothetical protein F7725_024481 [Dissostichus mawsoni]|uniref:Uncharacterized protein n=1 Tax=Dissostichus mawsoni TaxID=36200 RepID=A0A7J5XZM7_DISMA|nr:hypothetical protein F7725_024481 [Dissostichus mawsoni]
MGASTLGKAASLDALLKECTRAFDDNGELQANLLPRILLLMHRCLDLGLIRLTEEFRDVAAQLGSQEHFKLLDISTIPSYDWMRKLTQRKKQAKKGKASLLFDHLEPMELAEHLTFLEFKSIRRISFTDYQSYVIHGCLMENPTLERSIALFNGVSQWVQLMVLSKLTPQTRAEVITKYIHVAQKLLLLQNFNTLMAVGGAEPQLHIPTEGDSLLSGSRSCEGGARTNPVQDDTGLGEPPHSPGVPAQGRGLTPGKPVSTESQAVYSRCGRLLRPPQRLNLEMTELVSSNNNYSCYRKAFSECQGFKTPILGVHLKDLIAVHVVFPDWGHDSNEVNLVKMHQLYMTFNELVSLQTAVAQVEPNMDLIYLLTSVFRNYDHDHDGYISQEDFESIAANFPFLDSFCVLDKDQDGLISKDEMIAYFLRANPLLQCKMGPGFIHNFQEMTYLKPTFCEHCAGFLWGIIKQGYKCKDCGVNCHKQCRELLVLACRKLIRSGSLGNVSPVRLTHSSLPSSPALPTCEDEDEVFEFPAVPSPGPALAPQSITLMTGSAQGSQTQLGGHRQRLPHLPKNEIQDSQKIIQNKGFARWENQNEPAVSTRCSVDSQEKSVVSGEPAQNGRTHRVKDS